MYSLLILYFKPLPYSAKFSRVFNFTNFQPFEKIFQRNFLTCDTLFSRSDCKSVDGHNIPELSCRIRMNSLQGDTFEVGIVVLTVASSSGRQQGDNAC